MIICECPIIEGNKWIYPFSVEFTTFPEEAKKTICPPTPIVKATLFIFRITSTTIISLFVLFFYESLSLSNFVFLPVLDRTLVIAQLWINLSAVDELILSTVLVAVVTMGTFFYKKEYIKNWEKLGSSDIQWQRSKNELWFFSRESRKRYFD